MRRRKTGCIAHQSAWARHGPGSSMGRVGGISPLIRPGCVDQRETDKLSPFSARRSAPKPEGGPDDREYSNYHAPGLMRHYRDSEADETVALAQRDAEDRHQSRYSGNARSAVVHSCARAGPSNWGQTGLKHLVRYPGAEPGRRRLQLAAIDNCDDIRHKSNATSEQTAPGSGAAANTFLRRPQATRTSSSM